MFVAMAFGTEMLKERCRARVGNWCVLHRPTLRPARSNLVFTSGLTPKTCRVQAIFVKNIFVGKRTEIALRWLSDDGSANAKS